MISESDILVWGSLHLIMEGGIFSYMEGAFAFFSWELY